MSAARSLRRAKCPPQRLGHRARELCIVRTLFKNGNTRMLLGPIFWPRQARKGPRLLGNRIATACALAYPLAAHTSIILGSLPWVITALALISVSIFLPGLLARSLFAWILAPLVALALWALARLGSPVVPLYVAPVLVPAFMAWVFGHTLAATRTPLIAQLIAVLHTNEQPPQPDVWTYARQLTRAWTVFFVVLATTNLLLALLAEPAGLLIAHGVQPGLTVPQAWWSWFANVIGYALVAVFFVIEYAYRRRRFPEQPYRNIFEFFKRVGAAMPQLMRQMR